MIWVALYKRADKILSVIDAKEFTQAEVNFLKSMRDRKIIWGTPNQAKYLDRIDEKLNKVVQTQAVSGANNRSR